MKKLFLIVIGLIPPAFLCSYIFAEDIMISTYYPAPHGVYKVMRLYPSDRTSVACSAATDEGNMFYDDGAGTDPAGLYYCDGVDWQTIGEGFWTSTGDDIYNTNTGNVGIGTSSPSLKLHLFDSVPTNPSGWNADTQLGIEHSNNNAYIEFKGSENANQYQGIIFSDNTAAPGFIRYRHTNYLEIGAYDSVRFLVSNNVDFAKSERMRITSAGNVGIGTTNPAGLLDVNGAIYQRGAVLHADYVFEPDYKLESIEEHARYMFREKNLKAVPRKELDENGQQIIEIGSHSKGILEELEKAHIYIHQLNERIKELEEKIEKLKG